MYHGSAAEDPREQPRCVLPSASMNMGMRYSVVAADVLCG
jgi:hypothetical protein